MNASLPLLEEGVAHHRAGNLAEAERAYRAALAAEPGNIDAYHLLGLIADEAGHHRDALELIRAAVAARPHHVYFESLGRILTSQGERDEAAVCFANALALSRVSQAAYEGLHAARADYDRDVEPVLHVPPEAGLSLPVGGADVLNLPTARPPHASWRAASAGSACGTASSAIGIRLAQPSSRRMVSPRSAFG